MIRISSDAETDLTQGYWFYESQSDGLGDYFRDCLLADIDSLTFYAGIHAVAFGYHRMLSKVFPFIVYYSLVDDIVTVVAVIDARRNPSWIRKRLS